MRRATQGKIETEEMYIWNRIRLGTNAKREKREDLKGETGEANQLPDCCPSSDQTKQPGASIGREHVGQPGPQLTEYFKM